MRRANYVNQRIVRPIRRRAAVYWTDAGAVAYIAVASARSGWGRVRIGFQPQAGLNPVAELAVALE